MPYVKNFWTGDHNIVSKGTRPRTAVSAGTIKEVHVYSKQLDFETAIDYTRTLLVNLQPGIENDRPKVLIETVNLNFSQQDVLAALAFHNPNFSQYQVYGPQPFDARIRGQYNEGLIVYLVQ